MCMCMKSEVEHNYWIGLDYAEYAVEIGVGLGLDYLEWSGYWFDGMVWDVCNALIDSMISNDRVSVSERYSCHHSQRFFTEIGLRGRHGLIACESVDETIV